MLPTVKKQAGHKTGRPRKPRYNHLVELLDGAAALRMAIRQAERVISRPDLGGEDRELLESVLEASRERLDHIASALKEGAAQVVEVQGEAGQEETHEWSEAELLDAGRKVSEGSEDAEQGAVRAIERLGRSLKIGARGAIEPFLAHSSSLLRAASMKVLVLHWGLREYADRILWALAADEEPECRRAAALCLGSLYEGTRDQAIGRELVAALRREGEEEDVRWASYYALLGVEGRNHARRPLPIDGFSLPRDVDPEIVARYEGRA